MFPVGKTITRRLVPDFKTNQNNPCTENAAVRFLSEKRNDNSNNMNKTSVINTNRITEDTLNTWSQIVIIDSGMYYILLDEVQLLDDFEGVLNRYMKFPNVDIFVTGSNSKFLSTDVITEFRGRGDEVHIMPLSFSEYYPAHGGNFMDAWEDYTLYGGMPNVLQLNTEEQKVSYLKNLFTKLYLLDITERNGLKGSRQWES